jgi:predicted PurR-regulated permease PerM
LRNIVRYTTIILITISILVVLWEIREAVALFLLSLAAAAAFRPLVDYLAGKHIPRNIALLLSYGLVVAAGVGLLLVITGPLVRDIEQATNHFVSDYEGIIASWPESHIPFQRSLAAFLPPPSQLFAGMTGQDGGQMLQAVMGVTTNAMSFAENLGIILVLSLYWSADSLYFERLLLSLIPVEQRLRARLIWQGIEKGVGAYIRSELTQSVLAGILLWLGYRLMGLDYPILLAFLGALVWLVPWFGAILAVIPPFLVGLNSGLALGLLAAGYTLAVLVVQEYFIEPRIFRRYSYSSIILILVVLAMADAFGLLGLILAPLVSATLQIVFKYVIGSPTTATPSRLSNPQATEGVEQLQARLAETRDEMEKWENPAPPEVVNLTERLDQLIEDTRLYLN